jgi:hypothetical protein
MTNGIKICWLPVKEKIKVSVFVLENTNEFSHMFQNAAAEFLFLLFFSVIGQFSSVCASHKWLSEQFPESQPAFRTIFKITGSFWNN